jgi:hypothetical protein
MAVVVGVPLFAENRETPYIEWHQTLQLPLDREGNFVTVSQSAEEDAAVRVLIPLTALASDWPEHLSDTETKPTNNLIALPLMSAAQDSSVALSDHAPLSGIKIERESLMLLTVPLRLDYKVLNNQLVLMLRSAAETTKHPAMSSPRIVGLKRVSQSIDSALAVQLLSFTFAPHKSGGSLKLAFSTIPEFSLVLTPTNRAVLYMKDVAPLALKTDIPYFGPQNVPELRWVQFERTPSTDLTMTLALQDGVRPVIVPEDSSITIYFQKS